MLHTVTVLTNNGFLTRYSIAQLIAIKPLNFVHRAVWTYFKSVGLNDI